MSPLRKSADALDGSEPPEEAIPLLVDAHGGRLFALGRRFCGNPDEAEDLVQETFLQAFRFWNQFDGRAKPSTWLYTIASRVCQRFHRKRAGEPDRLESLEDLLPFADAQMAVVPEEVDEGVQEEARRQVEHAIGELPLDFRMPFVLKEIVGLSVADVATVLDLKQATVKTRLYRARLRIRKAIEGALPRRDVPPTRFSQEICLDLLQAKQDCLDRGQPFAFPDEIVCERCAELFATMDLAHDVCTDIARGELPPELRARLLERLQPPD